MKASRRWGKWLIAAACVVSFVLVPVSAGAGGALKFYDDPHQSLGEPDVPEGHLPFLGDPGFFFGVWFMRLTGAAPQLPSSPIGAVRERIES